MKAIERRIFRLEKKLRTQHLDTDPSPTDLLRQRRRRWMEAEGKPFEEPEPCSSDSRNVVEILRQVFENRSRRATMVDSADQPEA